MPSSSTGTTRGLGLLGEVDALDVEEAAEHRVGAAGEQRRHEVEADVHLLDRVGVDAGVAEDRLEVGVLVRDPGGDDGLALEVGRLLDARVGQRDQRGQRPVDERRDGDHVEALVAGEHHLGLVGDRQVGLPGGDLLDRRRRDRRGRAGATSSPASSK